MCHNQGPKYDEAHSEYGPKSESKQVWIRYYKLKKSRLDSRWLEKYNSDLLGLILETLCRYPHLYYPEMYLMKGGYKEFFNKHSGAYQVLAQQHLLFFSIF